MMKACLLMWFMALAGLAVNAQVLTITDKETGKPIEGATVMSDHPRGFTTSNALGQADISAFAQAREIQIHSLGYQTIIADFSALGSAGNLVQMEPSSLVLDEVVVSGTRWKQAAQDIPSKIVTIGQREIKLQNPQTAADLLGISGKVFIQKSQQGGGSPMIRGFATNRLIYTIDGVRMNTAIFRGGNLQNVINLDPFAVESSEVLFGPGSVIYGSDAIGGVMSFQTLTPQLSMTGRPLIKGKAVARYSSANKEKTGHIDVGAGWKKWALVTSFSAWDFDHLRQGSNGPEDYLKTVYPARENGRDVVKTQDDPLLQIPSAYSQINLMQKLRFKPNEKWDFQYGFHYSKTSTYGRYDRHNRFRNNTIRYAEWNYGPQAWMMNSLSATHDGNNAAYDQMSLRIAQQSFEESRIERALNSMERITQSENVEAYSLNLDFNKKTGLSNTLFYGAEVVRNDVHSSGLRTDVSTGLAHRGPSRYPQSRWNSIGVYVNDQFRISERFLLQGGVRYNYFQLDANFDTTFYPFPFTTADMNNGALTGSLGFVFRPTKKWVIHSNFGTAFRSPNVDDMGKVFDAEPGTVTVPNPNLEAEYAYNFDLGFAKIFGEVVKLDITGYYTLLRQALVRRDFQLNGQDSILYNGEMSRVQAIQNAAIANVYGVQAGIEVKFPAGFSFLSDINFQRGEEELENGMTSPSRSVVPVFGISRLRYKKNNLTLELNASYQGERSFDQLPVEEQGKDEIYAKDAHGNNYSPAWYTVNLKGIYQFSDAFNLNAGIENITDQRYRPYSSGISGAGRNFVISVQLSF